MSLSFSSPPWSYDSSSPYPATSPSSSDSEYDRDSTHTSTYLRSSIGILPEEKLRHLMLKLANRDPRFHRAIMKELSRIETDPAPTTPTTPTPTKQRKWHRKSRQNMKSLTIATNPLCALSQGHHEIDYMYHPGPFCPSSLLLESERSLFFSRSSRGRSLRVHISASR
jgi:hypothetical protein